ncbi:uncharacterized protein LOC107829819 [Nicotiana tabacum]|uniref:Uncharacterized protein LOC107829819 n=1 Tax=Nicotiana tabacum TaxID=4097 RepID=A0AC58UMJ1_TOBAC
MKGVMRFGKKGKLSSRFIGSFEVFRRIGEVDYELALLPNMSSVHPVFHVSMLRKYIGDPSHVLNFSTVQLDDDLTYDVEPVAILGRQVWKLSSKDIASVKVQWRGRTVDEATWGPSRRCGADILTCLRLQIRREWRPIRGAKASRARDLASSRFRRSWSCSRVLIIASFRRIQGVLR